MSEHNQDQAPSGTLRKWHAPSVRRLAAGSAENGPAGTSDGALPS